jgi:hypothetical protein
MDDFINRSGSRSGRSGWGSGVRKVALGLLVASLLGSPTVAVAGRSAEMSKQAGLGFGSAIGSLIYAPVKLCYAIGGLVVGGLAWAFSGGDNEVASVVLTPSILGDYVLTPEHLRGEKPIEFFGRDPDYIPEDVDVAASPASSGPVYDDAEYDQTW